MALNPDHLTSILLRKTDAELETIASQAEQVALGGISSISALSQSTTFDPDAAGVILAAVERVRQMRARNPDASPDDLAGSTLGHSIRFQPVKPPQGITWGC